MGGTRWAFVAAGAWLATGAGCSGADIDQVWDVDDASAARDSGVGGTRGVGAAGSGHSTGGAVALGGRAGSGGDAQTPTGTGGSGGTGGVPSSGGAGPVTSGGTTGTDAGSSADSSGIVDATSRDASAAGGAGMNDASRDGRSGSEASIGMDASSDASDARFAPPVDAGPVVACATVPAIGSSGGADAGVDGGADGGVECPFVESSIPDLWAQVCSDKRHYAIGETVTLTYRVENRGASDVTLTVNGDCDQEADITVSAVGLVSCMACGGDCFPGNHPLTIAAGGTFVITSTWNQSALGGSQVPPGTFTVQGGLLTEETVAPASSTFSIGTVSKTDAGTGNLFGAASSYRAGTNTQSVALGDLDGNGTLDVAIAQANAYAVAVMRGVGDGTFGCPASFPIETGSESLALSDFDRNGRLDVAAAVSYGNGGVALLEGAGDATFTTAPSTKAGFQPWTIATGDVNHDRKPDLVVGNDGASVSVLIGHGDMSFDPAVQYDTFGNSVGAVALGDLNGDKNLDIVAVETWSFVVLLGDGTGAFGAPRHFGNFAQSQYIKSFALADFDADGKLDFAVPMSGSVRSTNVLSLYLGNGDGTFKPQGTYDTGWGLPSSAVARDFDGDGKLDIAEANVRSSLSEGYVAILLGNGDGTFRAATEYPVADPVFVTAGDLNGDKKPDLVVANDWNFVSVLLNTSP
jgi:hypothetical protein